MIKTAESVTPKHPDKICDIISDSILEEILSQDKKSMAAIEVVGGHGEIHIMGEVSTAASVDYAEIARVVSGVKNVYVNISKQSKYISQGVSVGGAGDQGIMVGYACNENESMIPNELYLSRSLCKSIYKEFPYDGKTQITLKDGKIKNITASFQNARKEEIIALVQVWLESKGLTINGNVMANPSGDWCLGGFDADSGLTGRKLVVDSYGPMVQIGGGAFSGKDPSKVDRSAAYMARHVAVSELEKYNASEVFVFLSYAIGVKEPTMAFARIDGIDVSIDDYDLTPQGIIKQLDLLDAKYSKTAEWGHFGNGFAWDKPKITNG